MFGENFRVYGVRKVWRQLRREGFNVARCTIARLTQAMGLAGLICGKPVRTTVSNRAAPSMLYRSTDCLGSRGVPMKCLLDSASFHSRPETGNVRV